MPTCQKCGKVMADNKFYTYRDGSKTEMCKSCLTLHVDNFKPETFLWLLQKLDVPYIEEEWNKIRDKAFAKSPNLNGMSVFGKYLSKMKLNQFKDYHWADTERLKTDRARHREELTEEEAAAMEEQKTFLKEQWEKGEISEAEYMTLMPTETLHEEMAATSTQDLYAENGNAFNEDEYVSEADLPNPAEDLTDEDKKYLAIKWGRLYKLNELIELEKNYQEMMNSFDIQDADTKNTLTLICKANLKANQAIDCGDIDGFQKLSRASEQLRKSGKFTAAQNKDQGDQGMNSIGELVAYCEKNGGAIPKYEIKVPYDLIDKIIDDLKRYTKNLIYEDKALASEIENYIKQRQIVDQMRQDRQAAKENGLDQVELDDEDYNAYYEEIENQKKMDAERYAEEVNEE